MSTLDLSPEALETIRRLLARFVPGAEVWAYGSRANGGAHEGSDLDLVVRDPEDLRRRRPDLTKLREALGDSDLPMLVDVFDWSRIPESFQRTIEREHVVIQGARRPAGPAGAGHGG